MVEFVEAILQTMRTEGINLEGQFSVVSPDAPSRKVHLDIRPRVCEQSRMNRGRNLDRQNPILHGVRAEDVRDFTADHNTDPVVRQRPSSMLPRAPTTEVLASDKDLSVGRPWIGERCPVRQSWNA